MTVLKCKCGGTLEEGFMGVLWCSKCEGDWEVPDGVTPETHPDYYMTIGPGITEMNRVLESATPEEIEWCRENGGVYALIEKSRKEDA